METGRATTVCDHGFHLRRGARRSGHKANFTKDEGTSKKDLAIDMSVDIRKSNWNTHLLGLIKREFIFHGDQSTYQIAKNVSDGFEHSFASFDEIREPAQAVVAVKVAAHIRQAILELSEVSEEVRSLLLAEPFVRPKGPFRLVQYVFGHIVGEGQELAAPGQAYPILQHRFRVEPSLDPKMGETQVRSQLEVRPHLASGMGFRFMRHEVWDGSTIIEAHEVDAMLEKASNSEYELSTIREPEIEGMFADKVPGAEHFRSAVGWFVTNVGFTCICAASNSRKAFSR